MGPHVLTNPLIRSAFLLLSIGTLSLVGPLSFSKTPQSSIAEKLRENVAQMVGKKSKVTFLTCESSPGAKKGGRGPASLPHLVLSYKKGSDSRTHQFETELINNQINQIRELTIVPAGSEEYKVERRVSKTFRPQVKGFRIDAQGQDDKFNMQIGSKRSRDVQSLESLAPLIKNCCDDKNCRAQINSPTDNKKK